MPAILCHRAPPLLGVCQCVNVPKTSCFFSLQYFDSVWGQKESETVEEKFKTVSMVDLGPAGYPGGETFTFSGKQFDIFNRFKPELRCSFSALVQSREQNFGLSPVRLFCLDGRPSWFKFTAGLYYFNVSVCFLQFVSNNVASFPKRRHVYSPEKRNENVCVFSFQSSWKPQLV